MTTEHKAAVKEKIEELGLPFIESIYNDVESAMNRISKFENLKQLTNVAESTT